MNAQTLILCCSVAALAGFPAYAKLPDPSPEAKAKADLTKAENAHKDKVAAYQLCLSQNAVAKRYLSDPANTGKKTAATPPCADPGAFVPPPVAVVPAAAPAPTATTTPALAAPLAPVAPAKK